VTSQSELATWFSYGNTKGYASNVVIEDFPNLGVTALIGYRHAVYATRDKATGKITYFSGWYGLSQTTSCQLTKMGLSHRVPDHERITDETVDKRKKRGELRRAEKAARRGENVAVV
jgi:hypothetical protein